jgi:colicin import membrane protein
MLNAPIEQGTSAESLAVRLDDAQNLELPDWLNEQQRGMVVDAMQRAIPRLESAHTAALEAEKQAAELERLRQVERDAEILRAQQEAAEKARQEEAKRQEAERAQAEQARQEAERRAAEAEQRRQQEAEEAKRRAADIEERRKQEAAEAQERERQAAERAATVERERIEAEQQKAADAERQRTADREHRAVIHREILADLCDLGFSEETARAVIEAVARGQIQRLAITY